MEENIMEKLQKWELALTENKKKESNITDICDHLNIGSYEALIDEDNLTKHSITSVLEISSSATILSTTNIQGVLYNNDVTDNFDDIADKINNLINNESEVVVVSDNNIGISASACVAYLVKYQGQGVIEAVNMICEKNTKISIAENVLNKLQKWEQEFTEREILVNREKESNITDICDNLNIASYAVLNDEDILTKHAITSVVQISSSPSVSSPTNIQTILVSNDVTDNFDDIADKINNSIINGDNVAVACDTNIGISASACVAYLVKYQSYGVLEAVNIIFEKKSKIIIGEDIIDNLLKWKQELTEKEMESKEKKEKESNITEIYNLLNIGYYTALSDEDSLTKHAITSVFEISSSASILSTTNIQGVLYNNDVTDNLDDIADKINNSIINGNNVVVASDNNIGISASACVAYLVKYQGQGVLEAVNMICEGHPKASIEEIIIEKLQTWELKLTDKEIAKTTNITEIYNHLNVASYTALTKEENLTKHTITTVVEISSSASILRTGDIQSVLLTNDITQNFGDIADKINKLVVDEDNIVVVSDQGDSVAVSACIAYLVKYQHINVEEALSIIEEKIPHLMIDVNIKSKLQKWELSLNKDGAIENFTEEKNLNMTALFNNLTVASHNVLKDSTIFNNGQIASLVELSSNPSVQSDFVDCLPQVVTVSNDISADFDNVAYNIAKLVEAGGRVLVTSDENICIAASACLAYLAKYEAVEVRNMANAITEIRPDIIFQENILQNIENWFYKLKMAAQEEIAIKISKEQKENEEQLEKDLDNKSISEIFNCVNLSSFSALKDADHIKQQGITSVLELSSMPSVLSGTDPLIMGSMTIADDVTDDFGAIADKLDILTKAGEEVLIVCDKGEDIAASVCIAYLVKYQGMEVSQAVDIIHQKRNEMTINEELINKLKNWEQQIKKEEILKKLAEDEAAIITQLIDHLNIGCHNILKDTETNQEEGLPSKVDIQDTNNMKIITVDKDIYENFSDIAHKIATLINSGEDVLIKCGNQAAIASSACIAYFVKYQGFEVMEAANIIKQKRSQVNIDEDIIQKLQNWKVKLDEDNNVMRFYNHLNFACSNSLDNPDNLVKQKVTAVLQIGSAPSFQSTPQLSLVTLSNNGSDNFEGIADVINNLINDGNEVVVTCDVYTSTAIAACIAYLVKYQGLSVDQAENIIHQNKSQITIHQDILDKLKQWELLFKQESAKKLNEEKILQEEKERKLAIELAELAEQEKLRKIADEKEQRRKIAEEESKKQEEIKRKEEEKEGKRQKAEELRQKRALEEAKRKQEEEERKRKLEAEEAKRQYEELERARILAEQEESRITEIYNHLSLSNYRALRNVEVMKTHGISFIIEINSNPNPNTVIETFNVTIPEDITQDFGFIADKINSLLCSDKYILIVGDKSSSMPAAACIAYMIKYHGLRPRKAAQIIQDARPNTIIDIRTISRLEEWQWKLRQQKIKQQFLGMVQTIKRQYHPAYIPYILALLTIYLAFKMFQEKVEDEYRRFVKLPRQHNIDPYDYFDVKKWP